MDILQILPAHATFIILAITEIVIRKRPVIFKSRQEYPKRIYNFKKTAFESGTRKKYATVSHVWKERRNDYMSQSDITFSWRVLENPPGKIKDIIRAAEAAGDVDSIWIDSLCINQDSEEEKASEVYKMEDIYKNSYITYIWLFKKESADIAMELSNMLREDNIHLNDTGINRKKIEFANKLADLCNDRWFSRCWTLQETVMNSNVFILIPSGKKIDIMTLLRVGNKCNKDILGIKEGEDSENVRPIASRTEMYNALQLQNYKGKGSALYVLHLLRNRGCEKPRDVIYSSRGLMMLGNKIKVSYEGTDQDVMDKFVETMVAKQDLTMLAYPSINMQDRKTYSPILNEQFLIEFLSRVSHVVSYNPPMGRASSGEDSITVKGIKIGTVQKTCAKPWSADKEYDSSVDYIVELLGANDVRDDEAFRCGSGLAGCWYNRSIEVERTPKEGVARLIEKENMLWNLIMSVRIEDGINDNITKRNCIFCNQKVHTTQAKNLRKHHDVHTVQYSRKQMYFQAAGSIEEGDIVIDINNRSWEGLPAFLVVRAVENNPSKYIRTGVTRCGILVVGGSSYEEGVETFNIV